MLIACWHSTELPCQILARFAGARFLQTASGRLNDFFSFAAMIPDIFGWKKRCRSGRGMDWKSEYSVGIEELDRHHQFFFEFFHRLDEAIQAGRSWSDQYYVIEQLREYAKFHFAVEESIMRMHGYPKAEHHAAIHRSFIEHIQRLEKKALNREVTLEIADFMRKWFTEHICGEDKEYALAFAERIGNARNA
jgi:hemerythrin